MNGFGITTSIINGGLECGKGGTENIKSAYRIMTYKHLLEYFDMDLNDEVGLECKDLPQSATWGKPGYYGNRPAYF